MMSSSAPTDVVPDLAALRAELDQIDDSIHGLLMQRAQVVERVARAGKRGAYRPGREASIIRRLLHRHGGSLPAPTLVRMWREMLAGTTAMQGTFIVAVCDPDGSASYTQAAREHFGTLTPLHTFGRAAQAMAEVSRGAAAVAVLPMPSETDTRANAWWIGMLQNEHPRMHIVARLPFWAPRPDGAPAVQALVVATTPPDASERDRSLLGGELDLDVSRARLTAELSAAGFPPETMILRRDQGAPVAHALIEVEGFVADNDWRLTRLQDVLRQPVVLGAYAEPEAGGAA